MSFPINSFFFDKITLENKASTVWHVPTLVVTIGDGKSTY